MSLSVIGTLVAKDLSLFFRNRFFALITVLGLVFYAVVFFVLPSTVDEAISIGLYSGSPVPGVDSLQGRGVELHVVDSEAAVRQGVIDGEYLVGAVLPAGFPVRSAEAVLYLSAGTPQESRDAVQALLGSAFGALAGQAPLITFHERMVGPDLAGRQIPPRDRLRPLMAVLIIMVETMGMANLISREIERDTISAVLVTPVTRLEFFAAKGITGTLLALTQALILMAVIGGMSTQPAVLVSALLLGSVMVVGIGFVLATLGRDMFTVIVWGMLVLVVLSIPSIGILFPGVLSGWVRAIPSYYLVQAIDLSMNFGLGWSVVWQELLLLAAFDIAALAAGVFVLARKAM